jgi:hypothetical protein
MFQVDSWCPLVVNVVHDDSLLSDELFVFVELVVLCLLLVNFIGLRVKEVQFFCP